MTGRINEALKEDPGALERSIDEQLMQVEVGMHDALVRGELSDFWSIWSSAVENAMLRIVDVPAEQRALYGGRGQ
eukprot:15443986-Alexandrium_andersonii.AAC.1